MQPTDKNLFVESLEKCFANYREPVPLESVIDDWMEHLQPYGIMQVGNAIEHHKRNSRFVPVLADILALLPKDPSDWPEAETAFSEMLQIESGRYALTTREHLTAFEVARPLLEARDRFNASRAFVERYTSLVTAAKNAGSRAAWFLSLPTETPDQDGLLRREALREGARIGRITKSEGKVLAALLPPPPDKVPEYNADGTLSALPAPSEPTKVAHSEATKLRDLIARMKGGDSARDQAPDVAATRAAAAEQDRKANDYVQAQQREKAEAEAYRMIASLAHLSDGEIATYVRLIAEHVEVA